jgi:hypothetical protein
VDNQVEEVERCRILYYVFVAWEEQGWWPIRSAEDVYVFLCVCATG